MNWINFNGFGGLFWDKNCPMDLLTVKLSQHTLTLRKSTMGIIVLTNLQKKTWGSILWENSKPFREVDTKGLKGTSRLKGKIISICLYIHACICACIYPPWDGTANLCEATANLDKVATTLWESTTSQWESGVPSMPLWDPWMPLRSFIFPLWNASQSLMGQRWSLRQINGDRLEPTTTDLAPALS